MGKINAIKAVLFAVLINSGLLYGHAVQPKPIYYPDAEYSERGEKIPVIPKNRIAILHGSFIGRDDYVNWLVERADSDYLFQQYAAGIIIKQQAGKLGLKPNKKEVAAIVMRKVDEIVNREKARADFYKYLSMANMTMGAYRDRQRLKCVSEVEKYYVPALIVYRTGAIPESEIQKKFCERCGIYGKKYKLSQLYFQINPVMLRRQDKKYDVSLAEAKEKAGNELKSILEKIKDGESFEEMARLYSDDGTTKYSGGYTGKYEYGSLGAEFDGLVKKLGESQAGGIVESKEGFHIVKVVKKENDSAWVSHILKAVNPFSVVDTASWDRDRSELLKKIELINGRIQKGEDFKKLSSEYSDDFRKAYGEFGTKDLDNNWDRVFGDKLNNLKKSDIAVLETGMGIHLVKVEKILVTDLSRVREEIKKEVAYDMVEKDYDGFIRKITENGKIIKY